MEVDVFRKATRRLGELQVAHPGKVLLAAFVFTVLVLPGFTLLYFDTSNENFLPEKDPVVESLFLVASDFEGLSTLTLLFFLDHASDAEISDLRDPMFLQKLDRITQTLEKIDYINSIDSPTRALMAANNGVLPTDKAHIERLLAQNPSIRESFNADFSIVRVQINGDSFGYETESYRKQLNEVRFNIESIGLPEGVYAKTWGETIQFIELNDNLGSALGLSTILGFMLIFGLVILFYRSVVSGVLSIFPIVLALLWTLGVMGYIRLPFTMLTSGFIPLVMGLGVDYSIHLIHSIKHLVSEGHSIENAILETMEEIGESITAASITTSIGFLSLVLASLLVTQRLGQTLTLSAIFIFVACIVIVPPTLLLSARLQQKSNKTTLER